MNRTRRFLLSAQVRDKSMYKIITIFTFFLFFTTPLISGAIDDEDFYKGYQAYQEQRYNDAIKYFERAAKLFKDKGFKSKYGNSLNNIASVYDKLGDHDKAMDYFKKAIVISEELGEKDQVAVQLDNISMIYFAWGQYDTALINSKKALAIFEELGKKKDAVICLIDNVQDIVHRNNGHDIVQSQL